MMALAWLLLFGSWVRLPTISGLTILATILAMALWVLWRFIISFPGCLSAERVLPVGTGDTTALLSRHRPPDPSALRSGRMVAHDSTGAYLESDVRERESPDDRGPGPWLWVSFDADLADPVGGSGKPAPLFSTGECFKTVKSRQAGTED